MKRIIIDSCIWIGAFIKKDKYHRNGKEVLKWLEEQQNVKVLVPIGVIYEVTASIMENKYGGFRKAKMVFDLFLNHEKFDIYYNSEQMFQEIENIFKKYEIFSLVDSTIILLYINKNCHILFSTDNDFNHCNFVNKLEIPIF